VLPRTAGQQAASSQRAIRVLRHQSRWATAGLPRASSSIPPDPAGSAEEDAIRREAMRSRLPISPGQIGPGPSDSRGEWTVGGGGPDRVQARINRHTWKVTVSSLIVGTILLLLLSAYVLANPLPLPKPPDSGASCPHGWLSSSPTACRRGVHKTPSRSRRTALARGDGHRAAAIACAAVAAADDAASASAPRFQARPHPAESRPASAELLPSSRAGIQSRSRACVKITDAGRWMLLEPPA
jgi:hypothetical protein